MTCNKCNKEMTRERVAQYHYKESGLDTVHLNGITVFKCDCGHKLVYIPGIEELHDAIAYHLLKKPSLLAAKEFRFIRKWIGLTMNELAKTLGVSRITIHRCEKGGEITRPSDHLLRMLAMRKKEEECKRRMYFEIVIQELFEKMANKQSKPAKITIDVEKLLQHPSQARQESQSQCAGV